MSCQVGMPAADSCPYIRTVSHVYTHTHTEVYFRVSRIFSSGFSVATHPSSFPPSVTLSLISLLLIYTLDLFLDGDDPASVDTIIHSNLPRLKAPDSLNEQGTIEVLYALALVHLPSPFSLLSVCPLSWGKLICSL